MRKTKPRADSRVLSAVGRTLSAVNCLLVALTALLVTSCETYTVEWRYETNGAVKSSPAIGSDGTIYVGSANYYVIPTFMQLTRMVVSGGDIKQRVK